MQVSVRPTTGQIQSRTTTTMPLEYFDNPDMELVTPEKRLENGPVQGYSRFYTVQVRTAFFCALVCVCMCACVRVCTPYMH